MDPAGLLDTLSSEFPAWAKPLFWLWFFWCIIVFWTLMNKGDGRERWLKLVNGGLANFYRRKLRRFLGVTSRNWFRDQRQVNKSRRLHKKPWLGINTFTAPAFAFTLVLALFYPLISLLLFWALTGKSGVIVNLLSFLSRAETLQRFLILLGLLVCIWLVYKKDLSKSWKSLTYLIGAGIGLVAFHIALMVLSISFDFIVANFVDFVGIFTFAGTLALTATGAWIVSIELLYKVLQSRGDTGWFWIGFIVIYPLVALSLIFWVTGKPIENKVDLQLVLLFYVLLPIVNATWDWLSLGVTRSLLYAIVDRVHSGWHAFFYALMDGVLALIFLFFITLTTTATIALMNRVSILGGGAAIVDLDWVFDSLRFDALDPDHWWLYFMFFSTLIPTVVHMVIASLAVLLWIPRNTLQQWTADWQEEQHKFDLPKFLLAWGYLSVIAPFALIMPLLLTFLVFAFLFQLGGANTLGTWLVDFMQNVACWINP